MIPQWPNKTVNFIGVSEGVECTMKTFYNGVVLSVSEIGEDVDESEQLARKALDNKVRQRKAFK
jgi:hypothetical protein